MMPLILMIAGLGLLLVGGEFLVRGAVSLSVRLHLSKALVGAVVMGFGTSAPELLVGIEANLDGYPGLAAGNVIGSNICNFALILGVASLMGAARAQGASMRREILLCALATLLLFVLLWTEQIMAWQGWAMAIGMLAYILIGLRLDRQRTQADKTLAGNNEEETDLPVTSNLLQAIAFSLFGIAGLIVGAELLVSGASDLARLFGVSEAIIGLTLVAFGTSLPELAATVAAGVRKQDELAAANVVGSCSFNILVILGVTAGIKALPLDPAFLLRDGPWLFGITAIALAGLFVFKKAPRPVGYGLLGLYAAYVGMLAYNLGML